MVLTTPWRKPPPPAGNQVLSTRTGSACAPLRSAYVSGMRNHRPGFNQGRVEAVFDDRIVVRETHNDCVRIVTDPPAECRHVGAKVWVARFVSQAERIAHGWIVEARQ